MAERHTPPLFCFLPTHVPAEEAEAYQAIHAHHCADNRPGHSCAGRITIDRLGITLSCPRCGDHRSLFPTQAGRHNA
jgi:predicted RNA-binding Zn-ribbon protein involved in translation (DUF1610 family)